MTRKIVFDDPTLLHWAQIPIHWYILRILRASSTDRCAHSCVYSKSHIISSSRQREHRASSFWNLNVDLFFHTYTQPTPWSDPESACIFVNFKPI